MENLMEIPEPVGQILINKISEEKVLKGHSGNYYHYADICSALDEYRKECLVDFLDGIKEYEHESGKSINQDDRESSEIVEIFLSKYKCRNKSDDRVIVLKSERGLTQEGECTR